MVLDHKLFLIRDYFGIQSPEDWQRIRPDQITAVPHIGDATLNHLRLHLAGRGLTLQDDQTPTYWQSHLDITKIGTVQVSDEDRSVVCPFTVLVDSAEQHPFTFAGFRSDASRGGRPMVIPTRRQHLGPTHGDYSVSGLEHHVHIERKSREDVQATVLGWGERREQFERTLSFLAEIASSAIVIECTRGEAILSIKSRGKKSDAENQKIFQRQVAAWEDDYRVPWKFCDNRRLAEIECFRQLERQWRHVQAEKKRAAKYDAESLLAVS